MGVLVLPWRQEVLGEEDRVYCEGEGQQQQLQERRWGQLLESHHLVAGAHAIGTPEHPRGPSRSICEPLPEKGVGGGKMKSQVGIFWAFGRTEGET